MNRQKIVQVMKKEEIPLIILIIFCFTAIASFGALLLAPFQIPRYQSVQYHAFNPNGWIGLAIAVVIPIVIALLVGICLLLWKMKWPSE